MSRVDSVILHVHAEICQRRTVYLDLPISTRVPKDRYLEMSTKTYLPRAADLELTT